MNTRTPPTTKKSNQRRPRAKSPRVCSRTVSIGSCWTDAGRSASGRIAGCSGATSGWSTRLSSAAAMKYLRRWWEYVKADVRDLSRCFWAGHLLPMEQRHQIRSSLGLLRSSPRGKDHPFSGFSLRILYQQILASQCLRAQVVLAIDNLSQCFGDCSPHVWSHLFKRFNGVFWQVYRYFNRHRSDFSQKAWLLSLFLDTIHGV